MPDYYNDHDPFVCSWLKELMKDGLIPEGHIDDRSISAVNPDDLRGYERVHLFAGIGGWAEALRLAEYHGPIWTGSPPCQPFSMAGKGRGHEDDRNLWPEMARLIRECKPAIVVGEQVPGAIRLGWLDGVFADLEAENYACGAVVLGAHSVGAPHIRQRLYWVAYAERDGLHGAGHTGTRRWDESSDCRVILGRDGKTRRIPAEPALFPLAHGVPNRVGTLRGAGNAIVPPLAAEFLKAALDAG